jgi:DNA-binding transcriptional LysR family regulator
MADRRLQVFHAVAKYRSFSRAAEVLFMSQPSVTVQIRQLEEAYAARLFDRKHGSIELTAIGELVFDYAERILALSGELETRLGEMTGEIRGTLRLAASSALAGHVLPGLLAEFNAAYPQVRICLSVLDFEQVIAGLDEQQIDAGLTEALPAGDALKADVCGEDQLVVVCTPDIALAKMRSISPQVLVEYEYLAREPGSGTRRVFDDYLRAQNIAPETLKIQMELGSSEALKGMALTGLGFAILPRLAVDREIHKKMLAGVPLKPALKRPIYLVYPNNRFRSRLSQTFTDFARRRLREEFA